jgi:hypothetical protein
VASRSASLENEKPHDVTEVGSLSALVELVLSADAPMYVRFSPTVDLDGTDESVDHESGLPLPGLSVNPLRPPAWWQAHAPEEWIARQVRTYQHLKERDDVRRCWIVAGTITDRGPDNEPLLADVEVVGVLTDAAVEECAERQSTSARDEDTPNHDGSAPWQST